MESASPFHRRLLWFMYGAVIAVMLLTAWAFRPYVKQWYAEWKLRQKLAMPITVQMTATPFADAQVVMRDLFQINIELGHSLQAKLGVDTPVTVVISRQPATKAVEAIATQLGVSYTIHGSTVVIGE